MKNKIVTLLILLFSASLTHAQIPYGNNVEAGQFIYIHGVKHYYEVYGKGSPMVLIHGNGTGISGWSAQIAYFSNKYKVYAFENRGRGKSDLGNDTLTYMQMAGDIAEFMKVLQLDSVTIVGKSDGGIIAVLMGIYYPEHIVKMVAFGTNLWPDSTALYPETVKDMHDTRVKAETNLMLKDTTQNWKLIAWKNRLMEFQPHVTASELHRIKCPVLIMSCDRDVIKEEHTMWIYKNIPKANLCILPGETHFVARQNAELFNKTVDRYLSQPYHDNRYRFQ